MSCAGGLELWAVNRAVTVRECIVSCISVRGANEGAGHIVFVVRRGLRQKKFCTEERTLSQCQGDIGLVIGANKARGKRRRICGQVAQNSTYKGGQCVYPI